MSKVALQASSCYNKPMKNRLAPAVLETPRSLSYTCMRGEANGHSILFSLACKADPLCFPLLTSWRKVIMAPRKDTPEYDAWKQTPEYEVWRQGIVQRKTDKPSPMKGKHPSQETKDKMSAAQKGKPRWSEEDKARMSIERKGRKLSPESKSKLSASMMGHKVSPETRAKISKVHKGRTISPEARVKASAKLKGRVMSDEWRKKQSIAHTGREHTSEAIARMSEAKKGHEVTPETRAKLSVSIKAYYDSLSLEEQIAYQRRGKKFKDTSLEVYIASELDRCGIAYEKQKRIGHYTVDFLFPEQMLIWEVNGCFWHGCLDCGYNTPKHAEKREHDRKRQIFLESKGYTVVTIWQHDLPRVW